MRRMVRMPACCVSLLSAYEPDTLAAAMVKPFSGLCICVHCTQRLAELNAAHAAAAAATLCRRGFCSRPRCCSGSSPKRAAAAAAAAAADAAASDVPQAVCTRAWRPARSGLRCGSA
eukprot:365132-Chlamydomonas_euryale.AAC.3